MYNWNMLVLLLYSSEVWILKQNRFSGVGLQNFLCWSNYVFYGLQ